MNAARPCHYIFGIVAVDSVVIPKEWTGGYLRVIDISGAEVTALTAHSLEAGNLQVRNNIVAQGQLQVTGGLNVGSGGVFSDGDAAIDGKLAVGEAFTIYNSAGPSSSPPERVQLYAQDNLLPPNTSELKVRDEAGNVTVLSPHNFSLIGRPSEPMAWSHQSENHVGRINVDMLRAVRLIEAMSGEKLVHIEWKTEEQELPRSVPAGTLTGVSSIVSIEEKLERHQAGLEPLIDQLRAMREENHRLQSHNEELERRLRVLEERLQ